MTLRIATFNVENLDDLGEPPPRNEPSLAARIAVMRPQLERLSADVLCLQEVHSQHNAQGERVLSALDALLDGTSYAGFHRATTVTVEGQLYHERNLVVLSRHPISATHIHRDADGPRPSYQMVTANPEDETANTLRWERPILHVEVDLGQGRTLHLINLHLKSRLPTTIPGQVDGYEWRSIAAWAEGSFISSMKRVGQALQTRMLVDGIFDGSGDESLIAVCGDLNCEEGDVPMLAMCGRVEDTGNPVHTARLLIPCERNIPESARYSLWHVGRGSMFDHVLASRALMGAFSHAEVHNEALPDESGAFRTDVKFPESDHAPVVAEFRLA